MRPRLRFVHELQPSLSFATMTAVASVHVEETRKRESFGRLHRQLAWTFVPLVVNTSGKWGRCARKCMQSLVRYRSLKFGTSTAAEATSCWSAVNHALAAAVARQLERAFPSTQAPRGHAGPALEQDVSADTAPSSNDDRMHVATDVLGAADTYSVVRSPRMLRLPGGSVEPLVVSLFPTQP